LENDGEIWINTIIFQFFKSAPAKSTWAFSSWTGGNKLMVRDLVISFKELWTLISTRRSVILSEDGSEIFCLLAKALEASAMMSLSFRKFRVARNLLKNRVFFGAS
jgi:hypothetical protein